MVKAKYEAMLTKLEGLIEKHELVYKWDTSGKDVALTVRPAAVDGEQVSFIEDTNDGKSSSDAAISFIFKDGAVIINTAGKLFISESLINKLKTIAKKLHYLYLQVLREEYFAGGCDCVSCDREDDDREPGDQDEFEEEEMDDFEAEPIPDDLDDEEI